METQEQHPFVDRLGRIILAKSIIFYFKDNEILARGFVKRKVNNKDEFIAIDQYEMPHGWYHRKEYDYFYYPNTQNIVSILKFKKDANDRLKKREQETFKSNYIDAEVKFADSFCIFVDKKIKEYTAAEEAINKVKGLTLDNEEEIKQLPDIMEKRTPDFLHQKIASQYGFYLPECGLLEEQGLGKTKTAIETFAAKKEVSAVVDKCLVIGPLSVINRNGWGKQISLYAPEDYSYVFLRGTKEEKIAILDGDHGEFDFYLINYEGLANIEDEILAWVDDRTMVVCDETSKIKNFYANRTKLVCKIGALAVHKMVLTGTPITQGAFDIFSQFYFLDGGDTFGQSYDSFIDKYFHREGWGVRPKYHALEDINEKIFKKSIRFTKEVIKDLPEKTYQLREVNMAPLQSKYYYAILQQEMLRLSELEKVDAQNILVTILRLQQITSGFISPKDSNDVKLLPRDIEGGNPKLSELKELLDEIGDKPIVIWSRFRPDINRISKMLEENHIKYITYVGGMSELRREESERKFLTGEVQVFVSIPAAGGLGMNLQCASYAIYYCNDYSLQNRLQSEDRIHRMGQKNNCSIIDIVCKGTIDQRVLEVLTTKKEIADIVVGDNWREFLKVREED